MRMNAEVDPCLRFRHDPAKIGGLPCVCERNLHREIDSPFLVVHAVHHSHSPSPDDLTNGEHTFQVAAGQERPGNNISGHQPVDRIGYGHQIRLTIIAPLQAGQRVVSETICCSGLLLRPN